MRARFYTITAGTADVYPWAAIIMGFIGGCIYLASSKTVLYICKVDDPLDAFSVHGACGFWGVIALALFMPESGKLKGGIGHDMLRVRGTWNIVEGGPDDDDIGAEGNQNMLYGEDGDDTLFVPTMGGSLNILDGGPHVATDTCGADCMANTCVDCFP